MYVRIFEEQFRTEFGLKTARCTAGPTSKA